MRRNVELIVPSNSSHVYPLLIMKKKKTTTKARFGAMSNEKETLTSIAMAMSML